MTIDSCQRLRLLAAFAVVYLVWGSTYLGIRIGVTAIPPLLLSGTRNLSAGVILAVIARSRGQPFPMRRRDWLHALVIGVLLVTLGNGLVTWGEQYVQSNQAALIATTSALWTAWFGTFGPKRHVLSTRSKIGIVIGFIGAVLMLLPGRHFSAAHMDAQLVIVFSAVCWGAGAIYGRTVNVQAPPLMLTAMLLTMGGGVLTLIGLAGGEASAWHWTIRSMGALVYLTLIGSCVAYATYVWLIQHTTPDRLGTIAYVNPVIALFLGWMVLDEKVEGKRLIGILVILVGVITVTTRLGRFRNKRMTPETS